MMHTRSNLATIPEYQAGRLGSAQETIESGVVLLSSNEAPWAPSEEIAKAVRTTVEWVNRYPSMTNDDLREALARWHATTVDRVVVGCGGVEIGRLTAGALVSPRSEVLFSERSFQEYTILAHINSATPVTVPARELTTDLDAIADRVGPDTSLVIVCNPNNPTGTGVPTSRIVELLDRIPEDLPVLVDEAYWEFTDGRLGESAVSLTETRENLVVLRTFSKAFGLAGLRVGYGICGSLEVASAMRKLQLPFSVNMLAQVAALAALDRVDEVLASASRIATARDAMHEELLELGFDIPVSHANFLYVPGPAGLALGEACAAAGVSVRGDGDNGVRITVGLPEENARVLVAARRTSESMSPTAGALS